MSEVMFVCMKVVVRSMEQLIVRLGEVNLIGKTRTVLNSCGLLMMFLIM